MRSKPLLVEIVAQHTTSDIMAVPNLGSDATRTFLKNEGPRGLRGEALSLRWRGRPPANAHTVVVEYTEEN